MYMYVCLFLLPQISLSLSLSLSSFPPLSLQLDLAESQDRQPSRLSPIYISLARTHIDCAQFPQAEMYYKKELEYCCSTPIEVS